MAGDRSQAGQVSWQLRLLNFVLRRVARPRLLSTQTPVEADADFDRFSRLCLRKPPYLLHLVGKGAPDLHWITSGSVAPRGVLLYFHGGAYIAGSPITHAGMLGRLSALSGLRVAAPRYRFAPEHPAPAQYEDAVKAHRALLRLGYRPEEIVLGGDSAGGGLALALLSELCSKSLQPAGAFAFSPWVDLTLGSASLQRNAATDPFLPAERVGVARDFALGELPAEDPRVSPLFATFERTPAVRIDVGSTEILLDDSIRMAERLRQFGGDVRLCEWSQAPHVWPLFDGYVPEARAVLEQVAEFMKSALHQPLAPRMKPLAC